jgi:hypothetical protein
MAILRDTLEARYANVFRVGHNEYELVLDFGQAHGEGERETFHTRIVTAPAYGRVLLEVLEHAVTEAQERSRGHDVAGPPDPDGGTG